MVNYERFILDNGMTVILHKDLSSPMVVVNILYKVGSKNEDQKLTGLAHLFEHLMFTGTETVSDFDIPIQQAGGDNNAFTSNDVTNYYSYAPANNLALLLWLEADRMTKLSLEAEEFKVQKKVVIEEFYETCIDEPYGDIWHHICKLAYKKHPYKWPVIGNRPADIKRVTQLDAKDFYLRNYQPSNAILTVTGNFSEAKVRKMIINQFNEIPNQPIDQKIIPKEPKQRQQRRKIIYAKVSVPAIYIAFHIPARIDEEFYVCDLLSDILASGRSARLHESLVKKKKLFSSIDAYTNGTSEEGLLVIDGKISEGVSPEEAEAAIWTEVDDLMNHIVDQRELDKIINKSISTLTFSEYSLTNKAMNLAYFESIGDISLINTEYDIYQNISASSLQRVAKKIFDVRNSCVIYYLKKEASPEKLVALV
ncbi:MAG: insulinase family protein [Saprospiraceae bacterium]|jgi:zinc protease|uniref:M16 family metallopeptidase n=1 Tax=Candidatus Brachybacter algidus TaxID=2982024 RepID=UPI001B7B67AB|nr:pitrilysin family protein [Candidatus Brachybacter algidus]MBP8893070.1 insulinase family protein [Saprospiraceae bacterium]MBK6373589.1 insulinase family protein [Candidatus Brachybacter algidus]MBK6450945.1 insulinase family protein [Candidatus Brachybacter algidus]MBK8355089.1 insulinase family protein [Candidatus Brachybacter algidus]MBK8602453.1 insulinase family protein [Candidatus Brachybacter algidus]